MSIHFFNFNFFWYLSDCCFYMLYCIKEIRLGVGNSSANLHTFYTLLAPLCNSSSSCPKLTNCPRAMSIFLGASKKQHSNGWSSWQNILTTRGGGRGGEGGKEDE